MTEQQHTGFVDPRITQTSTCVETDRALLMSICYRLLGSSAEAEDAVQEAFARWYALSSIARSQVTSPTGWLVTTASRICFDTLGSARIKREAYVGTWLPEPVPGPTSWTTAAASAMAADPAERMTIDESIRMALLVVLETMTPAERVSFILHDVFGYPFADIGAIVGRSAQACRQLASSARRRVRASRSHAASQAEHNHVVAAFKAAWESGDVTALVELLDPAATAITDGGGAVNAAIDPICGPAAISRFFVDILNRQPDLQIAVTDVNGEDGLIATAAGHTLAVVAVGVKSSRVKMIWASRNPLKLRAWPRS